MESKPKDILYYEKLRTTLLGAILVVLLALLIGALVLMAGLRRYEARIGGIVDRLETVSRQLEALDVEKLVATANELTDAVDAAKVEEIVASLHEIAGKLSEVDWEDLTGNINSVAATTSESLADAQAALQKLKDLDIESLNEAIAELQDVIEPLANFTRRLG